MNQIGVYLESILLLVSDRELCSFGWKVIKTLDSDGTNSVNNNNRRKKNSANFDSVHCIGNLWPTYNGNPIRRLPIVCVCVSLEKCKLFAVLTKDNSKSHNCYRYLTFKMQTFFVVCVLNEHAVRWMHVERSIHLLQWLCAVVFFFAMSV